MSSTINQIDLNESLIALDKYTNFRVENKNRHKAHILISFKGKTKFNSILNICVCINSNNPSLLIEGDNEYSRDYLPEYNNDNSRFSITHGTLHVHTTDYWGNPISIDITGK